MDEPRSLSRRRFVAVGGASIAALAVADSAGAQPTTDERVDALDASLPAPAAFRVLTAAEARDLDAITARILPSEPGSPGARELGVVACADRQLARPVTGAEGLASWRKGRAELLRLVSERHPGKTAFADLTPAQQDALLAECEHSDPAKAANDAERERLGNRRRLFGVSFRLTQIGAFSDPMYGGNRNKGGWRLLGFDDRHSWAPPYGAADRG